MKRVSAEDLDPYPGEFLKEDLEEKVFWSNQMLAIDYLSQGDSKAASECLENIALAHKGLHSKMNTFQNLCTLQSISALGPGGGYVLAPANHLQPDVPPQNVVALFQAARKYGGYPLCNEAE